jgi:hypothetical protein
MNIYFTDFFNIDKSKLSEYGAFNISLIADLPLFVDPFLLFNSNKEEYKELHKSIIDYLAFIRDKSIDGEVDKGLLKAWFCFKEVNQNWFGLSQYGSNGNGLGMEFAKTLNRNLSTIFEHFGEEDVTEASHLEKLCLLGIGVGKDHISDFTTNLIKRFLLEYTENFAIENIDSALLRKMGVQRAYFNYDTESWVSKTYTLPFVNGDYVLLTPCDILTKDDTFISNSDMYGHIEYMITSIENISLRSQINNYLIKRLTDDMNKKERNKVYAGLIRELPEIIDYYIRKKEKNKEKATSISAEKVEYSTNLYIDKYKELIELLFEKTEFYEKNPNSYDEAMERVQYLKNVIEDMDGYRIFYVNGKPIERESDFQILYKLTWFSSKADFNSEVNNGRGPVDFSASNGSKDKTLIEFKLASNSKLKQNLSKQLDIYKKAARTDKGIKVILYFNDLEYSKVNKILNDLELLNEDAIVLIDGSIKESASRVC